MAIAPVKAIKCQTLFQKQFLQLRVDLLQEILKLKTVLKAIPSQFPEVIACRIY